MIISFGSKDSEKIWKGERVKKLPIEMQQVGRRKLRMINNSQDISDLLIPQSNKLEKHKGKAKDFYSIRINDQWRIIFKWENNRAYEVEIVDYHK
jgi:toxin HigB-1